MLMMMMTMLVSISRVRAPVEVCLAYELGWLSGDISGEKRVDLWIVCFSVVSVIGHLSKHLTFLVG